MASGNTDEPRAIGGLRIGYLIQDFFPEVGAGPARALEMSRHWEQHGARVTIMTAMPNRRIPGRGDGVIDDRYRGRWFMREQYEGIATLRSWLYASNRRGFVHTLINNATFTVSSLLHGLGRRPQLDVIIASSPPFLPLISGVGLSRALGIPLVIELRDLWPDYLEQLGMVRSRTALNALFRLERWLLRRAAHTVVVTESFRERVAAKGIARDRITVVSNGVDLEAYAPSTDAVPAFLHKKESDFVVGYIGTFGRGQSLPTVVEAAALVAEQDRSIRFVLVGDGPDRGSLIEMMQRLRVTNVQVALPIPREQTRAFYGACDACLVPLAPTPVFQETVPSKLFEIMACERPIIAGMLGEGARLVNESGAGLQVPPGDARALADAILRLRAFPAADRSTMGSRGRAYATRHFDRRRLADAYLDLLSTVAGRSRALNFGQ
jgi:colanic acid biosynthesis glycosyl transferase WcaI